MNFTEQNVARLLRGIQQCTEALGVPRRLGGDATDKELADDKRIGRRVKHRLEVALDDWPLSATEVPPDGTGARMLWSDWWEVWQERALELREQTHMSDEIHSITRELDGLAEVLGDYR